MRKKGNQVHEIFPPKFFKSIIQQNSIILLNIINNTKTH